MPSAVLQEIFGTPKPIIAMAHFPPLPGTPLYDEKGGPKAILRSIRRDVRIIEEAGFDGIIFCNEGDRPYVFSVGPEIAATMAWVIGQAAPKTIPFGVDHLYDYDTALAVGTATGAAFVRGVFTGTYESDMGLWSADPGGLLRYRRAIGGSRMKLFMNVTPEFGSNLGSRKVAALARSAVVNGLADAVLIAGALAGAEAPLAALEEAQASVGDRVPVIVTTGVTHDSLPIYIPRFDGVVVGTSLKVDGYTWNPVDPERAARFMKRARQLRGEA
jgi:membrane complex biogenesis BtpA family protein